MSLKSVIFSFILIGVVTKCLVQGLQCYVCEDCNEYEDFKELHICGEISIETTAKPSILESSASNKPAMKPTSKPMLPENSDNYLDSEESHDDVSALNSGQKTTTKSTTTATNTQSKTTTKPTATNTQNKTTTKPTTTATRIKNTTKPTATGSAKPTTANPTTSSTKTEQKKPTTQSSTLKESTSQTSTASKTTPSTAAAGAATTTKPKPVALPDYDDYLEYEDPIADRRSVKSLLKINEPVCYMIKYQVNNTVFTNRGCTSFINANKYLTCQTLYNGAPMESCRICSSNGCNKFLSGESDEDDHGLPINAAGVMEKLGSIVLVIWVLINLSVF